MNAGTGQAAVGFVLLHGIELGAWIWDRVIPLLGRPAVAVDLPGRGSRSGDLRSVRLSDGVQAVVEDAERCDAERVVLVAHSFSGVLVPPVLDRLGSKAAAAVFVNAAVPREGKSWVDLMSTPQRQLLRLMYRLRPNGMLSPAGQNRKALCNDLDEETTEAVLTRRVPEAPGLLLDAVSPAVIPAGIPCHYIRLMEDRSTTDAAREKMIGRLGRVRTHDLPSGHLPMLSMPRELAALLDQIADARQDAPVH